MARASMKGSAASRQKVGVVGESVDGMVGTLFLAVVCRFRQWRRNRLAQRSAIVRILPEKVPSGLRLS